MALIWSELTAGVFVSVLVVVLTLLLLKRALVRLVCNEKAREYMQDVCRMACVSIETFGLDKSEPLLSSLSNCCITVYVQDRAVRSGIEGRAILQEDIVLRRVRESKLQNGELQVVMPCPKTNVLKTRIVVYRTLQSQKDMLVVAYTHV